LQRGRPALEPGQVRPPRRPPTTMLPSGHLGVLLLPGTQLGLGLATRLIGASEVLPLILDLSDNTQVPAEFAPHAAALEVFASRCWRI